MKRVAYSIEVEFQALLKQKQAAQSGETLVSGRFELKYC
jgi:hypothetical protein